MTEFSPGKKLIFFSGRDISCKFHLLKFLPNILGFKFIIMAIEKTTTKIKKTLPTYPKIWAGSCKGSQQSVKVGLLL